MQDNPMKIWVYKYWLTLTIIGKKDRKVIFVTIKALTPNAYRIYNTLYN